MEEKKLYRRRRKEKEYNVFVLDRYKNKVFSNKSQTENSLGIAIVLNKTYKKEQGKKHFKQQGANTEGPKKLSTSSSRCSFYVQPYCLKYSLTNPILQDRTDTVERHNKPPVMVDSFFVIFWKNRQLIK